MPGSPRHTGLANATVYKSVIQNAFFTTQHFHFPARGNGMFGWIFWTSHTLPFEAYVHRNTATAV
jgi:hypothetical protein